MHEFGYTDTYTDADGDPRNAKPNDNTYKYTNTDPHRYTYSKPEFNSGSTATQPIDSFTSSDWRQCRYRWIHHYRN